MPYKTPENCAGFIGIKDIKLSEKHCQTSLENVEVSLVFLRQLNDLNPCQSASFFLYTRKILISCSKSANKP